MSQLTLTDVATYVTDEIPGMPTAKIGRRLNLVIEDLYDRIKQIQYSTFTTVAPVESGTVSVANNSTAAVFSGSVLGATDGLRMVQIGDDSTYYVLTRTNATTGVLSSKYAGTTNATATYKIVYPLVTFPSTVGQVLRIWREGNANLEFAPDVDIERRLGQSMVGKALYFSPYIHDATGSPDDLLRHLLTPYPDAVTAYEYAYFSRPVLINPTSATPSTELVPLPTQFRNAVLTATLASCWWIQDKEVALSMESKVGKAIRDALGSVSATPGGPRRSAFDTRRLYAAMQDRPS